MSTRSQLQNEIRSLDDAIRGIDAQIATIQDRIAYASPDIGDKNIEKWETDLSNLKNRKQEYEESLIQYQKELDDL